MKRIFIILLSAIAIISCTRRDETGGGNIEIPSQGDGGNHRPGVDDPTAEDVIRRDPVPRYISGDMTLRGDEPGVLVSCDKHGVYSFINIDTGLWVDITFTSARLVEIVEAGVKLSPDIVTVVVDDGATRRLIAGWSDGSRSDVVIAVPYF